MAGRSGDPTRSPPQTGHTLAAHSPRGRSEHRSAQPATHVGRGELGSGQGFRKGAGLNGAGPVRTGPRAAALGMGVSGVGGVAAAWGRGRRGEPAHCSMTSRSRRGH